MVYKLAFWNMFTSVFAFGGGSSLLSYLYDIYIIKLHILTNQEFLKISVISQILPGPVALSFLAIVGFKVASFWGWLISIVSFTLFTSIFSLIFYKHAFKIKIVKDITKYLIPIIISSLFVVTLNLTKVPMSFASTNWIKLSEILFLTILSIICILFKLKNIYVVLINLVFVILFTIFTA